MNSLLNNDENLENKESNDSAILEISCSETGSNTKQGNHDTDNYSNYSTSVEGSLVKIITYFSQLLLSIYRQSGKSLILQSVRNYLYYL